MHCPSQNEFEMNDYTTLPDTGKCLRIRMGISTGVTSILQPQEESGLIDRQTDRHSKQLIINNVIKRTESCICVLLSNSIRRNSPHYTSLYSFVRYRSKISYRCELTALDVRDILTLERHENAAPYSIMKTVQGRLSSCFFQF